MSFYEFASQSDPSYSDKYLIKFYRILHRTNVYGPLFTYRQDNSSVEAIMQTLIEESVLEQMVTNSELFSMFVVAGTGSKDRRGTFLVTQITVTAPLA